MAHLMLLTRTPQSSLEIFPALALLQHQVKVLPATATALIDAPPCDAILVDGRDELIQIRSLTRTLTATGTSCPIILIISEGGLTVVDTDWGFDDIILDTAGSAEFEARLRLATHRPTAETEDIGESPIAADGLMMDASNYTAKLHDRALDLTFSEFELLRFLAEHPGRVFDRQQLLEHVWADDDFGGAQAVDVHIRRLRAKLGTDQETLVESVADDGYRFVAADSHIEVRDPAVSPR